MYSKVPSQVAGSRENYLPALDGLRFMAAMLVAGGHYVSIFSQGKASGMITTLTGLGMTLFFVLSGFVIHYNYCGTIPKAGGIRAFAIARFARLYPLYVALSSSIFLIQGWSGTELAAGQARQVIRLRSPTISR